MDREQGFVLNELDGMTGFIKNEDGTVQTLEKFRCRPHANPLSDQGFAYPYKPSDFDTRRFFNGSTDLVTVADVGCGYGGLLPHLSTHRFFADKNCLGLEIRAVAVRIAQNDILKLREKGGYNNIAVARCNAMKHFTNYFRKEQLETMFFLFPDPQFKKTHQRRRIISPGLLDEYSYCLKKGGLIYIATDVPELFEWMVTCIDSRSDFERLGEDSEEATEMFPIILNRTADADRAERKGCSRQAAVFRKV